MAQHYARPADASDPHRLPNVETFRAVYGYCPECASLAYVPELSVAFLGKGNDDIRTRCDDCSDGTETPLARVGWFWWTCLPGCLPDSEPSGPFETEADALADAREGYEE